MLWRRMRRLRIVDVSAPELAIVAVRRRPRARNSRSRVWTARTAWAPTTFTS